MKLLHHKHTGSHHPHEHTSYVALMLLLTIVGASLTTFTSTAFLSPGPELRTIGLRGTVPGTPPTSSATITSPSAGQRFTETPVTISGTCTEELLVEIFKSKIFAGSTICGSDGKFSLDIDLLIGKNDLTAHVFDALNQEGPASDPVTVYYDAQVGLANQFSPLSFGGEQLVINTDAVFRGTFPNENLSVPIDIIGGRAPYAINVQWGDASNKIVSRPSNESFRISHVYTKAGVFNLGVQATDADGRVAFLTVAAIVNGQPFASTTDGSDGSATTDPSIVQRLLVLWPMYVGAVIMVLSFWLGEQRIKHLVAKHKLLINTA